MSPRRAAPRRLRKSPFLENISHKAFLEAWWEIAPKSYTRSHREAGGDSGRMISSLLDAAQYNDTINARVYRIRERVLGI